ncbi:MAG: phage baseplate plug family protein [Fusobacteriaceae bacterium]
MILKLDVGDVSKLPIQNIFKEYQLGENRLALEFKYNQFDKSIYIDIYNEKEVALSTSNRLVYGINLLAKISYLFKAPCSLGVLTTSEDVALQDVTLENFGKEMILIYVEDV